MVLPPAVIPTAPIGALATRIEQTLSWQLVEHLAELLGPVEVEDAPDTGVATGEAERLAAGLIH